MSRPGERDGNWTLLTGHGRVLVEISRNPGARIRDISAVVGLTERTVQAIVADLAAVGYLTRTRTGRRTLYTVNPDSPFRHSAQEGLRIGPFLAALAAASDSDAAPGPAAEPASRGNAGLGAQGSGSRRPRHGLAAVVSSPVARRKKQDPERRPGTEPDRGRRGRG